MKRVRWQRHARDVARALGVVLPPEEAGALACRLPGWAVRTMTRATAPAWLFAALDQATREAGTGERAAVVVSVVSQGVKLRRLVLLSFEEFQALAAGGTGDAGSSQRAISGGGTVGKGAIGALIDADSGQKRPESH